MMMTSLQPTSSGAQSADPIRVEQLVQAIGSAMERACIQDATTAADVLSAIFTTLDRILNGMRAKQRPEDRFYNAKEISRILQEMLLNHGSLPN